MKKYLKDLLNDINLAIDELFMDFMKWGGESDEV